MTAKDYRIHYLRKNHYKTRSNRYKLVRTPGNRITLHYTGKKPKGPRSPAYLGSVPIQGVQAYTSNERHNKGKSHLTVTRPYGGVLTHKQLRERIIRAFLFEESRIARLNKRKKSGTA